MGRNSWKRVIQDLLAQGISEQFPNGETYTPPGNKLIQTELFIATNDTGYFYELPSEVTENSQVIECMNEFYIIITKFAIPKELPIPDSWVSEPADLFNIKRN